MNTYSAVVSVPSVDNIADMIEDEQSRDALQANEPGRNVSRVEKPRRGASALALLFRIGISRRLAHFAPQGS